MKSSKMNAILRNNIKVLEGRRYCCYSGCNSDQKVTRNGAISFFSFPIKDTERCSVWITHSGREEFRFLTPKELHNKRICELHFESSMFSNEFKTNLIKTAIPINYKIFSQETIQIDDDDDVVSDECESGIVCEVSCNKTTCENDKENHSVFVIEPSHSDTNSNMNGFTFSNKRHFQINQDKSESQLTLNGVHRVLPDVIVHGKSNENVLPMEEESLDALQQKLLSVDTQHVKTAPERNKRNSVNGRRKSMDEDCGKRRTNTKFHNLPPQTTQSDFYFQQCPAADETNSFSEPPDAELPLFVQQDSLASMPDEGPNSVISEPKTKKRKRNEDNDDLADQMRDSMKHLLNISALLSNNNNDEFELFGKSVAIQLKKMSLCTALTVQAKIQHLLSQSRIDEIQNKTKEKSIGNEDETEDRRTELKNTHEEHKLQSPQLSLNCVSDISENKDTEIG